MIATVKLGAIPKRIGKCIPRVLVAKLFEQTLTQAKRHIRGKFLILFANSIIANLSGKPFPVGKTCMQQQVLQLFSDFFGGHVHCSVRGLARLIHCARKSEQ
jgi:hypothetical protein